MRATKLQHIYAVAAFFFWGPSLSKAEVAHRRSENVVRIGISNETEYTFNSTLPESALSINAAAEHNTSFARLKRDKGRESNWEWKSLKLPTPAYRPNNKPEDVSNQHPCPSRFYLTKWIQCGSELEDSGDWADYAPKDSLVNYVYTLKQVPTPDVCEWTIKHGGRSGKGKCPIVFCLNSAVVEICNWDRKNSFTIKCNEFADMLLSLLSEKRCYNTKGQQWPGGGSLKYQLPTGSGFLGAYHKKHDGLDYSVYAFGRKC